MFYAVTGGRYEGVYSSWPEAADACKGQSGAVPKKFKREADAQQFLVDRQQQRETGRAMGPAQRQVAEAGMGTDMNRVHPPMPAGQKRPHGEAFGPSPSHFYVGHSNMVNLVIENDGHASTPGEGASTISLALGAEASTATLNAPRVHEAILETIKEVACKYEVEIPSTLELRGLTADKLEVEAVFPAQSDAASRRIGCEWVEKVIALSYSAKQAKQSDEPPAQDAPEGGTPR